MMRSQMRRFLAALTMGPLLLGGGCDSKGETTPLRVFVADVKNEKQYDRPRKQDEPERIAPTRPDLQKEEAEKDTPHQQGHKPRGHTDLALPPGHLLGPRGPAPQAFFRPGEDPQQKLTERNANIAVNQTGHNEIGESGAGIRKRRHGSMTSGHRPPAFGEAPPVSGRPAPSFATDGPILHRPE